MHWLIPLVVETIDEPKVYNNDIGACGLFRMQVTEIRMSDETMSVTRLDKIMRTNTLEEWAI